MYAPRVLRSIVFCFEEIRVFNLNQPSLENLRQLSFIQSLLCYVLSKLAHLRLCMFLSMHNSISHWSTLTHVISRSLISASNQIIRRLSLFSLPIKLLIINKTSRGHQLSSLINQILYSISLIAYFTHLGGARDSFWAGIHSISSHPHVVDCLLTVFYFSWSYRLSRCDNPLVLKIQHCVILLRFCGILIYSIGIFYIYHSFLKLFIF
jgi:hypothetical protein